MEPTIFALGIACSQVLMLTLIIAKSIYSHHKIEVRVLTMSNVDNWTRCKIIFQDPPQSEGKLCKKQDDVEKKEKTSRSPRLRSQYLLLPWPPVPRTTSKKSQATFRQNNHLSLMN